MPRRSGPEQRNAAAQDDNAVHEAPLSTTIATPSLLESLNPAQRQAVDAQDGPLLIFAGAGSGKTRVLTHRIAHVIATRGVRPGEILAVTFTNKAAREMRQRVEALLGGEAGGVTGMWLGTFHSIGVRILRRDGDAIGIPNTFTIYDEADRLSAIKRATAAAGIDEKRFPATKVAHEISAAKNELQDAALYEATAGAFYGAQVARIFRAYETELENAAALDFDDLLVCTVQLLRDIEPLREYYQQKFRYIFVDEYQDTNRAQYEIVSLLAAKHRNLTVVGDDDQCLIAGTRITMADGAEKPIEDVREGDLVLSNYGGGVFRSAQVRAVHRSAKRAPGISLTTASGRRLVSTREHTHFAGYRIGEPTQDRRLLADHGLSWDHPHHSPRSRDSNRRNVVVTLCGDRRSLSPMHRISVVGNDSAGRQVLEGMGLNVRVAKRESRSWRYESCTSDFGAVLATAERIRSAFGDAALVLNARLGKNEHARERCSLRFVPAGSVQPGMVLFDCDGCYDRVAVVEQVQLDTDVYDLDIDRTHNYIANGLITHNSIYGWRGADVRNILSFKKDYPDATVVTLEQNYRSTQAILDTAHAVIRNNTERATKKLWTERSGGAPVQLLSVYDEQEEALVIAKEIDDLVAGGDFSLSDIAVLYRTNAQSRAFEDVMLRRGMPYRLVGGVRFYERREVKDVLAYLRLVANPRDPIAFARIVNVPRRKIGDKTVAAMEKLARKKSISPFDAVHHLDEAEDVGPAALKALADFGKLVDSFRTRAATLPLPELVDVVLRESGYATHLRDGTPEGEERWSNVEELIGLGAEYAAVPPPGGLTQFLEGVALVSDVDTLDETKAGVTLITLHAVKGLEFPVVFLAGMEEGLLPHVRAMEEGEPGIAEERRLTYVGVTRAEKRLYLLHAFRRHLYGTPKLSEASRFLGEIPRDLLDIARRPGGPAVADPRAPGAVRTAVHQHAARANPVNVAPQQYQAGMRVTHPKFGQGTILKSTMMRSGEEVVIKFDSAGVKMFAVADAALSRI